MARWIALFVASVSLMCAPSAAFAASKGFNLQLSVAMTCTLQHSPTGFGMVSGDAVALGTFREFCNAPRGYDLVLSYTPGSLNGVRIIAGSDEIVLDGSGQAVLSRSPGPGIQERPIAAVPGQNGFDADRFELNIIPS